MSTITAARESARRTKTILAAEARLRQAFPDLAAIFCTFHDGILTLSGGVASTHLRELAAIIVQEVQGVHEVHNEVVVTKPRIATPQQLPSWSDLSPKLADLPC